MQKFVSQLAAAAATFCIGLLGQAAIAQEQTGSWTATGGYTFADGTVAQWTNNAGSNFSANNFSNIPAWTPGSIAGDRSLAKSYAFDTCETLTFTDGAGNPAPQLSPVIHLDRVGGSVNRRGNSAEVTLTASNIELAMGNQIFWTELSGTDDFQTTSTTAIDSSVDQRNHNRNFQSTLGIANGTASGSLQLNGIIATIELCFVGRGPRGRSGGLDGIEMIIVSETMDPSMTMEKALQAGSPNPYSTVSDTLTYTYTIENTGNVDLSSPSVTDDKISVNCPAAIIPVGQTMVCTSDPYQITQTDLNNLSVTNTATAFAKDPIGGDVSSASDQVTVPGSPPPPPSISLEKSADPVAPADFIQGGTVTYSYVVENTGGVTLTDTITIDDNKFPNPINCPAGDVLPGASVTCTAIYTLTDADITAGLVTNTAIADYNGTKSNTDSVTVKQTGTPELTLVKSVTSGSPFSSTADTIGYRFRVTNTGDVTLASDDVISINDPQISNVSCTQPAFLYPQGSGQSPTFMDCTGTFSSLTQQHLDDEEFVNTATASVDYTDPDGAAATITSDPSTVTVPANVTPSMTFAKSAPTPAQFANLGEAVTFTFEVTNTGL